MIVFLPFIFGFCSCVVVNHSISSNATRMYNRGVFQMHAIPTDAQIRRRSSATVQFPLTNMKDFNYWITLEIAQRQISVVIDTGSCFLNCNSRPIEYNLI